MSDGEVGIRLGYHGGVRLPRYRSSETVWALKIKGIDRETDGSAIFTFADPGYGSMWVEADYMDRHKPRPGGYYVVYVYGYKSYLPAEAFEDGYVRLADDPP